jgi:hypothetical protein
VESFNQGGILVSYRTILGFAVLLSLSGCGLFTGLYTLPKSNLKSAADDYGDVMDDFTDKALLRNILRARDYAPLNFSDLSAITAAFSVSAQLAPTVPFGPLSGSANAFKYSAGPTFLGSSSPVLTLGTLNTQGFMMTMIQPVSTTYILSKWNSHPHPLLLYLFIKSIRFPGHLPLRNDPDSPTDFKTFKDVLNLMLSAGDHGGGVDMRSLMILDPLGEPVPVGQTIVATTPIPSQSPVTQPMSAPQASGHDLGDGHPALSAPATYFSQITYVTASGGETVASPEARTQTAANQALHISSPSNVSGVIGYNVYVSKVQGQEVLQSRKLVGQDWDETGDGLKAGASPPTAPGTSYQVSSDYNVFQTINGLNDGQLHVGNAPCPSYVRNGLRTDPNDFCPPESKSPFVQFYKEYPAQIVLCVNTTDGEFDGYEIASFPQAVKDKVDQAEEGDGQRSRAEAATVTLGAHGGGQQPGGGQPTGGPSGGAQGASPSASTGGSGGTAGAMGQVTLNLLPSRVSAMVSNSTCDTDQIVLDANTEKDFEEHSSNFTHIEWRSIAEVIQYLGALARYNTIHSTVSEQVSWGQENPSSPGNLEANTLFTIKKFSQNDEDGAGAHGRIKVSYAGSDYGILGVDELPFDHSLQSIAMLNELIAIAKISGSLPVSQPVQVLP